MNTKTNNLQAIWGVVCATSSVDSQSNNISLYNILERITLTKGENTPEVGVNPASLQYEYVVLLQRSGSATKKETYPLSIRLVDPEGKILNESPIPAVFNSGNKRLRIRFQNNAIPITVAGEYNFEVLQEGGEEPLLKSPLEVLINES